MKNKKVLLAGIFLIVLVAGMAAIASSSFTAMLISKELSFQSSLKSCNPAGDIIAQCGDKYCECNGAVKPYCIDGETWKVKTPRCSKGVSTADPGGYYCVMGSATSSQPTQYTCDNGQSVWNNPSESALPEWCTDGKDNDYDGTIDCLDSECSSLSVCQTCDNGQTVVRQCSTTKPKYCQSRNNLVDKCSSCGCQTGYECSAGTETCTKDESPSVLLEVYTSPYAGSGKGYAGLPLNLVADITDDKGIFSAGWSGDKVQGSAIACSGKVCTYSTVLPDLGGTHTISVKATDTTGKTSIQTRSITFISCTSESNCGTGKTCNSGICGTATSPLPPPLCGDKKCHSDRGESYDSCPVDCPKPIPNPTNSLGQYICGTVAGLNCPTEYRCDYGDGRNFPPYPDAGGACILIGQSPSPQTTNPQTTLLGNQTATSIVQVSPLTSPGVSPATSSLAVAFPKCGGQQLVACPAGYGCNYGGGREIQNKPDEIGFCVRTGGDLQPTGALQPTASAGPQPTKTVLPIVGREIIFFGEERQFEGDIFRFERDTDNELGDSVFVVLNGQQTRLKEGEKAIVGGYEITVHTVLVNVGADVTIVKGLLQQTATPQASQTPKTVEDFINILGLDEDQGNKLKATALLLSLLSYVE